MKNYIGIDFGACNIKAAKISSTGKPQKIKLNKQQDGGNFIPNVILYDKVRDKIEIKMGRSAKKSLEVENKVWQIKSKLSQKDWTKFIKNLGREVDVSEVLKNIFAWIWQEITIKFPKDSTFEAVITAPVCFSEVQKHLIKQAALEVGVPVKAIINEPFAAIFSAEEFDDEAQCILVFDFGGSTLDLSLCRIERTEEELNVTELAAAGLKFGGIDIDNAIFNRIFLVKYADKVKELLANDALGKLKGELMNLIELLKEEIFINEEEQAFNSISDDHGNLHEFTLTHDEIISVLKELGVKEKLTALLDELLDDAQIDRSEVTQVKLFGGTSSIDYFRELLLDYFGEDIFDDDDFEAEEIYMSVAQGAARYLFMNADTASNITIENIIPYGIGLATDGKFNRLIKRNELSGFVTPFKPLLISELNKNNWRVAIYQTFSNDFDLPTDSEDVIFIGDVELDEKLYTAKDAILFKMQPDGAGQICMSFFEQVNDSDEPKFIEGKMVKLGG